MEDKIPADVYGFEIPEGMPCVWSARAIYSPGTEPVIDLLPDRMWTYGNRQSEEADAMHEWLNTVGIPALRSLCVKHGLRVEDKREVVFQSDGHVIKGTPNASYGYLYIVAYPLPA